MRERGYFVAVRSTEVRKRDGQTRQRQRERERETQHSIFLSSSNAMSDGSMKVPRSDLNCTFPANQKNKKKGKERKKEKKRKKREGGRERGEREREIER